MQLLDIDMDFFQSGIHTDDVDSDEFLKDDSIGVWEKTKFINFLEKQCRLSKKTKIKGVIVKHHVEVYRYWKQLLIENHLQQPFKVVHVDAHSDLGFSMNLDFNKFLQSIKDYAPNNIDFNDAENIRHINSGNYLLYAVVEGLISEIDYVYHEKLEYLDIIHSDYECIIPHKTFRFKQNDSVYSRNIRLNTICLESFTLDNPIDYITVAISPRFVKRDMLGLVEIAKHYIEL